MAATDVVAPELDPGIEDHLITTTELVDRLTQLRNSVSDPAHGVFGPDSMMWRMVEPIPVVPIMLIHAGLIEALHPKIWYGVERSPQQADGVNLPPRLARTYDSFMDWFCGDVETAIRRSRKIGSYHARVGGIIPKDAGRLHRGDGYRAVEQDLMIFTVGTQVVPIKVWYEILCGPLSPAEADQFYEDVKRFAMLLGVEPGAMPATWPDWERYWDGYCNSGALELIIGDVDPIRELKSPPATVGPIGRLVLRWFMTVLFNMLPDVLRREYEKQTEMAKKRPLYLKMSLLAMRTAYRLTPPGLRRAPRVRQAYRRAGAAGRPGPLEAWLTLGARHPIGMAMPSLGTPLSKDAHPANSRSLKVPAI